jgi:hypothetical protein
MIRRNGRVNDDSNIRPEPSPMLRLPGGSAEQSTFRVVQGEVVSHYTEPVMERP